jgi:hypothetical protein
MVMKSGLTEAERREAPAAARVRRPRELASVRFYVCVGLLVAAAAGIQALAQALQWHYRKEAVQLKRPLTALDWQKLAPRYRRHALQPPLLGEETIQALGTDNYLQVRLIDETRNPIDPTAVANVFITYYTGQPDMVPHVPDECYLAGGFDRVGAPETVTLPVSGVGAPNDGVPVRVLQFQSRAGRHEPTTVMYLFHTNGDYQATRTGVRHRLLRLDERYAYYAKIEVNFTSNVDRAMQNADREASLAALQPLLERLLPVLLEDHFAWDLVASGEYDPGRR